MAGACCIRRSGRFFLLYLVVTAQYTLFLRPAFGILLALAHFIAMGFMLAAVIRPRKKPVDASTAVRALVLLVPVLYYLATPNGRLGSQAFNKRFTGTGNGVAARQLELTFSSDEEDTPVYPEPLDGPIKEIGQNPTILNILLNPEKYTGKEVSIIGIFLRNEEIKPHFGGRGNRSVSLPGHLLRGRRHAAGNRH